MYIFELQDILFAIKSIKSPTNQFNINNYITFNSTNTRSGSSNKLLLPQHFNNISRHSYFHRLPSLWNAIPILRQGNYGRGEKITTAKIIFMDVIYTFTHVASYVWLWNCMTEGCS